MKPRSLFGIGMALALFVALTAALLTRGSAEAPTGASDLFAATPIPAAMPMPSDTPPNVYAAAPMSSDTPPGARTDTVLISASGAGEWPFAPLPLVIKGFTLPPVTPEVIGDLALDYQFRPVESMFVPAIASPERGLVFVPWLLAGVPFLAFGDDDDEEGGPPTQPPPPPGVIPEPATMILLGSGLLGLGGFANRRKRRDEDDLEDDLP